MRVLLEDMKGNYTTDFDEADDELARALGFLNPDGTPDGQRALR
jgi:hypothetical protein